MTVGGVAVDVCSNGCGGMWFDQGELRKFDEPSEAVGEALLTVAPADGVVVDVARRYDCPKCPDTEMMRHFASTKRSVTVDECPNCRGFWLDAGELGKIRGEFPSQEARRQAAGEYFAEVFGGSLSAARAQDEEQLARARHVANMFKFICPSYYIPGDQDWGAF